MPRIVSVWLPRWPVLRFLAAQARSSSPKPANPNWPLVLARDAPGGPRIAAVNAAAEPFGLRIGDLVADARAKVGRLQVFPLDQAADKVALHQLALWATRYTPAVSPWDQDNGADGFFLDITGATRRFDGEQALLADLSRRLEHFGLPARLAVASTAGATWALSRFHASAMVVVHPGQEAQHLATLPIEGLRLASDAATALRRLGFKRIGSLIDKPRAPFGTRFPDGLLQRLDQALGRLPEPLAFVVPPPTYQALRRLLEPIVTQTAIVAVTTKLMQDLGPALVRDGVGARCLQLALYRIDGEVINVDLGLTAPTRCPEHVARLIDLKLERIVESIDAGFGFETLGLTATRVECVEPKQTEFVSASASEGAERSAVLIDRLRQRLGPKRVRQLESVASHLPEKAQAEQVPLAHKPPLWPIPDAAQPRPILLLSRAEPTEVVALVPEGPPRRFSWRGRVHGVAHSQGPERIASEWWTHRKLRPTRDYYLVETTAGHRFWLYREGVYERETMTPAWFVYGLFA